MIHSGPDVGQSQPAGVGRLRLRDPRRAAGIVSAHRGHRQWLFAFLGPTERLRWNSVGVDAGTEREVYTRSIQHHVKRSISYNVDVCGIIWDEMDKNHVVIALSPCSISQSGPFQRCGATGRRIGEVATSFRAWRLRQHFRPRFGKR